MIGENRDRGMRLSTLGVNREGGQQQEEEREDQAPPHETHKQCILPRNTAAVSTAPVVVALHSMPHPHPLDHVCALRGSPTNR